LSPFNIAIESSMVVSLNSWVVDFKSEGS